MRGKSHFTFLLTCLLFLAIAPSLSAQQVNTKENNNTKSYIKGVLIDSLTKQTEPFVTMRIIKKGDKTEKAIKMAVSDNNGNFKIELPTTKGTYTLLISSIGKKTIERNFEVNGRDEQFNWGNIYLKEETRMLKGVEVVAKKPLVKMEIDKLSYDIEADPDSKTNTIIEMLRKIPLVTVDGENNIRVNGSSSFKIYVNGKPNTMMSNNPKDVLKSMPASAIKKIEVITSPGAKYDAEGTAGVLNIVTLKNTGMEGYNATISPKVDNRGYGLGLYGITKIGKFTMSLNYGYEYGKEPTSDTETYRENFDSSTQKYLDNFSKSDSHNNLQYGTIEASYEIDSLRLLSTSVSLYGNWSKTNDTGISSMWNSNRDALAYQYNTTSDYKGDWKYVEGNIDYQRVSSKNKDRMITFSYKLNTMPSSNDSHQFYSNIIDNTGGDIVKFFYLNNTYSHNKGHTSENTFQVDYTNPLGKNHKIETGIKYILRSNTSDDKIYQATGTSAEYEYQNDRSSNYKHLSDIVAAYLSYTFKYKKFAVMPGLRYEFTHQKIKYLAGAIPSDANFSSNYGDLVPSVTTSLMLGDTKSIRLQYNMRIMRPGIENLNPYFNNIDPMNISQGNSNIDSEKSNSFSMTYSSFSPKFNLNLSLSHAFNNNGIEKVSRLIGDGGEWFDDNKHYASAGALYTTYQNIGRSRQTSLSGFFSWNPTTKFQIFANFGGNYVHLTSPAQGLKNYGWTGSIFTGIQYTMPWKLHIGADFGGSTPIYTLQSKVSGFNFSSFRISRSFLKEDRLNVSLYASNIFGKRYTTNNTLSSSNFMYRTSNSVPRYKFGISVSLRIGKLETYVKKTEKSISNDDVKGGGNKANGGNSTPSGNE